MKSILCPAAVIAFAAIVAGCNKNSADNIAVSDATVVFTTDSLDIPCCNDACVLPAYSVSDFFINKDGEACVAAHNYKTNNIDVFNLTEQCYEKRVLLDREGPDGIPGRICWIKNIGHDSTLVFDRLRLYLVDGIGQVKKSYELPASGRSIISRNARTNIAGIYYDKAANTVAYPVALDGKIILIEYSLDAAAELGSTVICNDDPGGNYGFYRYPNVCVTDSLVIYNYPFDSGVNVVSRGDSSARRIEYPAALITGTTTECSGDVDDMLWHAFENPAWYDFAYLPNTGVYVQLAMGASNTAGRDDIDLTSLSRPMYVRVFDNDLNLLSEHELPFGKFNPYCGWFTTDDAVMLYNDNEIASPAREDTVSLTTITLTI